MADWKPGAGGIGQSLLRVRIGAGERGYWDSHRMGVWEDGWGNEIMIALHGSLTFVWLGGTLGGYLYKSSGLGGLGG